MYVLVGKNDQLSRPNKTDVDVALSGTMQAWTTRQTVGDRTTPRDFVSELPSFTLSRTRLEVFRGIQWKPPQVFG